MSSPKLAFASLLTFSFALPAIAADAPAAEKPAANKYVEERFIANKASYKPGIALEPNFINTWGIAIRPKGAGGHFWVTAKDVSYQYVGDVRHSPDATLHKLESRDVKYVKLPVGGDDKFATSVVFSNSAKDFSITQKIPGVEDVTAPAKFLFSSDGGIISAWTERKKPDGTFDRADHAETVIDQSKEGAQFFGLALSGDYSRLYAANFGVDAGIRVFDGQFKPLNITFDQPFDENKNGKVDAGEYAPFNVQDFETRAGEHHVFVTYAKTQACNKEGLEKKECKKGELYVGEEDTSKPGQGRLAEFTEDGKLVATWKDGGQLSAPWGLAYAPEGFGKLSGALLVGNFGSGSIAAYDVSTRQFIDVLRDEKGEPIKIEKVWGLIFGNGESLGDSNALYFAAGPEDEHDGLFGSLRPAAE